MGEETSTSNALASSESTEPVTDHAHDAAQTTRITIAALLLESEAIRLEMIGFRQTIHRVMSDHASGRGMCSVADRAIAATRIGVTHRLYSTQVHLHHFDVHDGAGETVGGMAWCTDTAHSGEWALTNYAEPWFREWTHGYSASTVNAESFGYQHGYCYRWEMPDLRRAERRALTVVYVRTEDIAGPSDDTYAEGLPAVRNSRTVETATRQRDQWLYRQAAEKERVRQTLWRYAQRNGGYEETVARGFADAGLTPPVVRGNAYIQRALRFNYQIDSTAATDYDYVVRTFNDLRRQITERITASGALDAFRNALETALDGLGVELTSELELAISDNGRSWTLEPATLPERPEGTSDDDGASALPEWVSSAAQRDGYNAYDCGNAMCCAEHRAQHARDGCRECQDAQTRVGLYGHP